MKKIIILVVSFIVVFLLVLVFFNISKNSLRIQLKGKNTVSINLNDKYNETGYKAYYLNKDVSRDVNIKSNINNKKTGTYKIEYKIKKLSIIKKVFRKIKVIDSVKPEIVLNGNSEISVEKNNNYKELGASSKDNYDGDITDNIKISGSVDTKKVGVYKITYTVSDSSGNTNSIVRTVKVYEVKKIEKKETNSLAPTYINGILIVNKKYALPSNYGGSNSIANNALKSLQNDAVNNGFKATLKSGFRSYSSQSIIYNNYVKKWGVEYTDKVSARPGHSEHQTGLAFDIGNLDTNYGDTLEGKWVYSNCYKYGFIIRYPKGKESITGYNYEPWHIRYVGVEVATYIMNNNITLEEYLKIA